jgi:hypothetical protein
LCNVKAPAARALDGVSLRPLLEGKAQGWPDRALFTHSERPGNERAMYPGAIRTQRYNLINGKELYEIPEDPAERHDLSAKLPDKVKELRARYEDWFQTALAERGFKRYPLPVGHPEENPAYLPATQAQFTGNLHFNYKNGYAHDWIAGWERTEDSVWWDIDVARAGRFSITLDYLCAPGDAGAGVEISAAGRTVRTRVEQPTAMEPLPDRNLVEGTHYRTMAFGKLAAGALELPAGPTRLTVRAVSKPGREVMQLKAAVVHFM